jgi:5-methyltetrahydropteroyltriglutamate--homocysteine methyltransferase
MQITVVGNYPKIPNLPRPARLRNALARLDRGEITPEQLAKVEDEVTVEVIKEQEEAGIELVTDGQVRWLDEQTYLAGRLEGISLNGLIRFFDTNTYYRQPVIEGPVVWQSPVTVRDYRFARDNASRPVKPVLTGPYTLARLSQLRDGISLETVAMQLAEALSQEAQALAAENPPLVQFNEPAITRHAEDLPLARKAWRRLLEGLSLETAVYFYFGSPRGAVAAAVESGFTTVGVDLTESGALAELQNGPRPQKLAIGVMDSRTTRLEDAGVLARRVQDGLTIVAAEDLYVNPNMGLEFLPREQAQAKLVRLVEGVNRVRGEGA